jgi:hypothetical protein
MTNTPGGNAQAFILAVIAFVGTFAYVLLVTIIRASPDPIIFPALVGLTTGAGSFFFSGHIANGAAAKALDALVQTGKDREVAVAAAVQASNGHSKIAPVDEPKSKGPDA